MFILLLKIIDIPEYFYFYINHKRCHMKKTVLLLLVISFLASCSTKITLINSNKSFFEIIIDKSSDSLTFKAAEKLQSYLEKITGTNIRVINSPAEGRKYIYLGKKIISDSTIIDEIDNLKDEGFFIDISEKRIILAGNSGKADLFAVSTFLEEYLGCMKFTGTEEFIPAKKVIKLYPSNKIYEPAFAFRHPYFRDRQDKEFIEWHKINGFDDWGLFVHTFQRLCPPEKYFDNHPEYFSLVNGRRIRDGQLCLSNPDVIKTIGDNLALLIAGQPEKTYWSVSQNDCINYCECESCKAQYLKYGNISGAYIEMANKLAARFPGKQISTLAYQFTRKAPENIKPLDNVNIMFCSIECNRSMPLATDPRSEGFVNDMKEWEKLSNNIFVWDYVVQFKTYLCPFPNFHVLQPNIRFFRDHNARMMFQQGSGDGWSDMSELKQYLISKLLWNPDINADSVENRFIDLYYGPASEFIKSYLNLNEEIMISLQNEKNLDIYGLPSFYFNSFLTGPLVSEYESLINKAQEAAGKDSSYLKRVLKTRCAVDFAYLDYALNAGDKTISFLIYNESGKTINQEMVNLLERFVKNCDLSGITNIGEEKLTVHEYRDHIMTILNLATINNKAKGKTIKSLTQYNPRYSDPGVEGLTDGIFGGRHFNAGWLGYEGNDMIVEIDFGKTDTIHQVSMNFLRDFVSWIFLPEEVRIELSADGKNYREAAMVRNVITDRRFGVEPVYHSLEFRPEETRFIKVSALSMKKCPLWHRGSGQPSWIFCDEIIVE